MAGTSAVARTSAGVVHNVVAEDWQVWEGWHRFLNFHFNNGTATTVLRQIHLYIFLILQAINYCVLHQRHENACWFQLIRSVVFFCGFWYADECRYCAVSTCASQSRNNAISSIYTPGVLYVAIIACFSEYELFVLLLNIDIHTRIKAVLSCCTYTSYVATLNFARLFNLYRYCCVAIKVVSWGSVNPIIYCDSTTVPLAGAPTERCYAVCNANGIQLRNISPDHRSGPCEPDGKYRFEVL